MSFKIKFIEDRFGFVSLEPSEKLPTWVHLDAPMFFILRTPSEISVLCPLRFIPKDITYYGPLVGFYIDEILEFSQVGILSSVLEPLKKGGISILAFSSYSTDYIFVREELKHKTFEIIKRYFEVID